VPVYKNVPENSPQPRDYGISATVGRKKQE